MGGHQNLNNFRLLPLRCLIEHQGGAEKKRKTRHRPSGSGNETGIINDTT